MLETILPVSGSHELLVLRVSAGRGGLSQGAAIEHRGLTGWTIVSQVPWEGKKQGALRPYEGPIPELIFAVTMARIS